LTVSLRHASILSHSRSSSRELRLDACVLLAFYWTLYRSSVVNEQGGRHATS